jgi:hypothetical protein
MDQSIAKVDYCRVYRAQELHTLYEHAFFLKEIYMWFYIYHTNEALA